MRHWIGVKNGQLLEWLEKGSRRVDVLGFLRPMRRSDKLCPRAAANIRSKNAVRVVKVRNDQIEFRKVIDQILLELAISRKESSEGACLDRLHAIHQAAGERKLG